MRAIRDANQIRQTGIMGFTMSGDPLVSHTSSSRMAPNYKWPIIQVGPVIDPSGNSPRTRLAGQYISAGYSGHGMPRAFAWSVFTLYGKHIGLG